MNTYTKTREYLVGRRGNVRVVVGLRQHDCLVPVSADSLPELDGDDAEVCLTRREYFSRVHHLCSDPRCGKGAR